MTVKTVNEYTSCMVIEQHQLVVSEAEILEISGASSLEVKRAIESQELIPIYDNTYKRLDVSAWVEKRMFSERCDDYGFYEKGYIHLSNWFDSKSLIEELNFYVDEIESDMPNYLSPVYSPSVVTGELILERVCNLRQHSKIWNIISTNSKIHEVCKNIYKDENYVFTNNRVIFKKPGCPPMIPHRDGGWSRMISLRHPMLSFSISLMDVSQADGGLGLLPNSNFSIDDNYDTEFNLKDDFIFESPGEGTLFLLSQGVVHGSILNIERPGTRRSLQFVVISKTDVDKYAAFCDRTNMFKNSLAYTGRNNVF